MPLAANTMDELKTEFDAMLGSLDGKIAVR
jgi:hypothetical protein